MLMLTEMVRGFDPYSAWLDVCEMRRPLTAYQLLDLAPLEDDLEAIRDAVGQKRAALESHRDEAPPEIWWQVHDELEEAVSILFDPDKKAAYDLALQPPKQSPKQSHAARHGPPGGVTDKAHGASLHCPVCNAANPATRKFCVHCGTNLWEPCFECGTLCSSGEKFCGACGANLSSSLAEHTKRFTLAFQDSEQLQAVNRFEEAIALLAPIADNDHPRLAEHAGKASQLIRQLKAQLARRQIVAEEALQRAEQRYATFDYEAAQQILQDVPRSLLSEAMQDLLRKCVERQAEIETLVEELRDAVRGNRVLDLLPRIERLLAIKPDHAYAQGLSEKVQRHLVAAAEKRLAKHQYDEAKHLIEQIASEARTPAAKQLHQRAAELAWLIGDLRNAPVIDKTLAAVAERLQRLAPDHPQVAKLSGELQRRIKLAKSEARPAPLSWANPPKETTLGISIAWLTGFRRLTCAETFDQSPLLQHPGCFAVAAGLALSGIKQANMPINLLANEQQGVLSRVTQLVRSRSTRSAWGIDLSTSGLKAVKLTWNETKQQAVIEDVILLEHAKSLTHAANEAEEKKLLTDTLQRFAARQTLKGERLCVGVPARLALCRQLDVPPGDPAKMGKVVQFEARSQFPLPLEQLAWDFHLFDNVPSAADANGSADKQSRRAFVIASQRAAIQKYVDAFQQLDLRIDALQTDVIALHNFLVYEHCNAPDELNPVAALDIGSDVTSVVVSSPHSLWFRGCGVAGHSFTRALVNEYKLSIAQAEQQKRSPETVECLSRFYDVLSPVFDDLLKEVQQSLSAFAVAQPDCPLQRISGLGGGFALHGLFRHLRLGR